LLPTLALAVKSSVKSTAAEPLTEFDEPGFEPFEHTKQFITVNAAALTPIAERSSFLSILI